MSFPPFAKELDTILRNLLLHSPAEVKSHFPKILHNPDMVPAVFVTNDFVLLTFIIKESLTRALELANGYGLYPGLITIKKDERAAFSLSGRNHFIINCNINNLVSFRISPDTTAIIQNHNQILNTKELGTVKYTIDLAYLLSFGKEITVSNYIPYLEGLIVRSIEYWRSLNE